MRRRLPLLAGIVLCVTSLPLWAQDPVAVNPAIAKVEFENDRVRVLRVHYEPHQKFGMHEHPGKLAVCVTKFHTRRVAADGTTSEGSCEPGAAVWREPEKHAVENLEDAAAETVEIELKYAHAPSVAVPAATAAGPLAAEPMATNVEPHHRAAFENQYVRVMDVQIQPGDTTYYHTHAHDTLFVRLSDSLTQSQTMGEDWGPTRPSKPGDVRFDSNSKKPLTHRVKNIGTSVYRVMEVELLP